MNSTKTLKHFIALFLLTISLSSCSLSFDSQSELPFTDKTPSPTNSEENQETKNSFTQAVEDLVNDLEERGDELPEDPKDFLPEKLQKIIKTDLTTALPKIEDPKLQSKILKYLDQDPEFKLLEDYMKLRHHKRLENVIYPQWFIDGETYVGISTDYPTIHERENPEDPSAMLIAMIPADFDKEKEHFYYIEEIPGYTTGFKDFLKSFPGLIYVQDGELKTFNALKPSQN